MDFGGRYRFAAPRGAVWDALNDATILGAAIPGCQRLQWVAEDALDLEIRANLGVAQPVFKGALTLTNVVPAHRYTLSGRGKGGLLGHVEGAADIVLVDVGRDTEMQFVARGGGSGQLMKLGRALIGNSAQRLIDGFFERFADAMGVEIEALPPP